MTEKEIALQKALVITAVIARAVADASSTRRGVPPEAISARTYEQIASPKRLAMTVRVVSSRRKRGRCGFTRDGILIKKVAPIDFGHAKWFRQTRFEIPEGVRVANQSRISILA